MVVGVPGVIVALLIKLDREGAAARPLRTQSAAPPTAAAQAQPGQIELAEIWAVTTALFGNWPVLNMVLGVTLVSFAGYGVGQFAPPYFIRAFGLDYATVGLIFGLIGGFSAGLGTLVGGFVTDWAGRRDARWYALTPAIGLAIATPIYIVAYRAARLADRRGDSAGPRRSSTTPISARRSAWCRTWSRPAAGRRPRRSCSCF